MALLMWGRFLINNAEKEIDHRKIGIISALFKSAQIAAPDYSRIKVKQINDDTGTIRSTHLNEGEKTQAASSCAFHDEDGVYVEVILFLDKEENFGELYIWKVNDTPVVKMPADDELIDFCKIY